LLGTHRGSIPKPTDGFRGQLRAFQQRSNRLPGPSWPNSGWSHSGRGLVRLILSVVKAIGNTRECCGCLSATPTVLLWRSCSRSTKVRYGVLRQLAVFIASESGRAQCSADQRLRSVNRKVSSCRSMLLPNSTRFHATACSLFSSCCGSDYTANGERRARRRTLLRLKKKRAAVFLACWSVFGIAPRCVPIDSRRGDRGGGDCWAERFRAGSRISACTSKK